MKSILAIGLLALSLSACTTAQDIATNINAVNATAREKVTLVQSYATQLCRFVPTASSVLSIFNASAGDSVSVIANAICNAVTTRPLADGPGDRIPRVNGVRVKGRFS
jgi:ABC-type Fe3+-hydroxamate transport system substrate-binding protein